MGTTWRPYAQGFFPAADGVSSCSVATFPEVSQHMECTCLQLHVRGSHGSRLLLGLACLVMFQALSLEMLHLWGFLIMALQACSPGAPAADLTISPPAPIAAAPSEPSRNNGSSSSNSIIELDGKCHTHLLNMSCSGDFLATSAHPVDLDERCGDAQCSWQKHVLATT